VADDRGGDVALTGRRIQGTGVDAIRAFVNLGEQHGLPPFHEELRIRPLAIGDGPVTHFVCVGRVAAERPVAPGSDAARLTSSMVATHRGRPAHACTDK
jgi:hypothetical protein